MGSRGESLGPQQGFVGNGSAFPSPPRCRALGPSPGLVLPESTPLPSPMVVPGSGPFGSTVCGEAVSEQRGKKQKLVLGREGTLLSRSCRELFPIWAKWLAPATAAG